MKMILFNQNPMITKLLESVSKKLELSMEDFSRYQELSTRLKEDPEWILIADDECLEKLDQVDWLELKETISQNKNSVCMYKKGNEAQPFLEGFEMKIKKPFLPTEVLKVLQKKLGSNMSDLEPSQNLDPAQEVLETNWDELENLGDLEALVQEEPNNEEQLLPTLNDQKEKEEVKEEKEEVKEEKEEVKEEKEEVKEEKEEVKEEKEEVKEETKETPQEEEKPKDDEVQEGEIQKNEEVSKELETQEELEIPKEETQEQVKEQEPIKEETQENKEEKQEKTQDSPSTQELEAMQELVKEIQENSNGQENKKETQENTETPQDKETQENTETPQELEKQELETPQELEKQELETPQELEKQELETPQELEKQELETQEKTQESAETPQEKTQKLEIQEDHYESIEDIPEPVMAQAMGEELPFLNESVAKTSNNKNDTETPKESVIKTPQEKEESDKTSSPLELRLNLQDLLKSLNQESLKSLLENKTLSIKITLEDKKPDA